MAEFRQRQRLIRWPSVLWSNRFYGLFHGPLFLRAFAAWVLPRWAGSWIDVD